MLGVTLCGRADAQTPAEASAGSATVHHYEYVFPLGEMYVYDMDNDQQEVQHVTDLPDTDGVRGVFVNPATDVLYISHGGDAEGFNGSLLAYNLVTESILWNRSYPFPVDSGAITPDGTTIYMPTGEEDPSGIWNVLNAANGEPIGSIQGPANAHNTIVSLNGKYVFLGGRESNYLDVASTATNEVVKQIGPLVGGVRPFTVNGTDTLAYTTATGFLGFQVSSIATGRVLYTVPIPGFALPEGFPLPPSHGITLTPDEQQLYVFDAPNEYVHVFDVSNVPASAPTLVANIKLSSIAGTETPCAYDCSKAGWLQASRDGRFVYVGDSGDVIDTETLTIVANLPPLVQTRQLLEIDWANGVPVATTSRYGLGYVTSGACSPCEEPEGPAGSPSPSSSPSGGGTHSAAGGATLVSGMPGGLLGQPVAVVNLLAVLPSIFRVGSGSSPGATIKLGDSAPANVTFTVFALRSGVKRGHGCVVPPRRADADTGKRCTRSVAIGGFTRSSRAGLNTFRFRGRIHGRPLMPGRYRLQAVPTLAGRAGRARTASFRIVAR